jgi:hypothetical protein
VAVAGDTAHKRLACGAGFGSTGGVGAVRIQTIKPVQIMKKSILKIAVFSLLAAALSAPSSQAFGQEVKKEGKKEKAAVEKTEKAPNKPGILPFRGKISAVDKTAKTITVGERTFQVTSETKIMKAEKPATLDGAAVGEAIRGSYKKTDDGKMVAQRLWIGPKPEVPGEAKKERMKEGPKKEPKKVDAQ